MWECILLEVYLWTGILEQVVETLAHAYLFKVGTSSIVTGNPLKEVSWRTVAKPLPNKLLYKVAFSLHTQKIQ